MAENDFSYSNPLLPVTDLSRIAIRRFGTPTTVKESYASLTTTASLAVYKNPNRVSLMVINNSPTTAYFSFGLEPSSTQGFRVDGSGGAMSMLIEDDGETITHPIYAVAASGTVDLTILETILEEN